MEMDTEQRRGPGRPRTTNLNPTIMGGGLESTPGYRDPKARAAEIRSTSTFEAVGENKFDIPLEIIPEGWDYMWVRGSTMGRSDAAYGADNIKARRAAGWEPVPAARHPELLPSDHSDRTGFIEREGLILMERPLEISREARAREERAAKVQMLDKERELGLAGTGQGERTRADVTQTIERHQVPD